MFQLMFALVFSVSLSLHSAAKEKGHSKEHSAHVHGSAQATLAFDGPVGKFEFQSPAQSIIGFEHEAKSDVDKAAEKKALDKFESHASKMLILDPSLKCVFSKDHVEVHQKKDGHSNFSAAFNIRCDKSVTNSIINFNFTFFTGLKYVDVTILADEIQKSLEVKSKPVLVEIKK